MHKNLTRDRFCDDDGEKSSMMKKSSSSSFWYANAVKELFIFDFVHLATFMIEVNKDVEPKKTHFFTFYNNSCLEWMFWESKSLCTKLTWEDS